MNFVGRNAELETLEQAYGKDAFQMVVIYGRRRVGKTALIERFCQGKRALTFTARELSKSENLRDFSQAVYAFFGIPETAGSFANWKDAFEYVAMRAQGDREHPFVLVFDEFPYAAQSEKSLPSTLQIVIDHAFKNTNVTMVLCGSNEGFMESEVLGRKSPLYGRRTAQIPLKPFDLFDAAKLMPSNASWEDKISYYATLGGTPYYLEQLSEQYSYAQNIERLCFNISGILYAEPDMLMRQELREPALYNGLLNAVGSGRNTPTVIADYIGMDRSSVSVYLATLAGLGIVERKVPFGENAAVSRKGLWQFKDPFFSYWYRFVSPASVLVERGLAHAAAMQSTSGAAFSTYVGQQFEEMCVQWLVRECREARMAFLPTAIGKWWGNDPQAKAQADIDIVMEDSINKQLLLGECKWRNTVNESETIATLQSRSPLIKSNYARQYVLFTKYKAGDATIAKAEQDNSLKLVDAERMFFER